MKTYGFPHVMDKIHIFYNNKSVTVYAYDDTEGWPTSGYWKNNKLVLLDRYAHLKRTVTFNANGGYSVIDSRMVTEGDVIGELPNAERDGYEFLGWFSEVDGGELITSDYIVMSNMTVYAQWRLNDNVNIVEFCFYKYPIKVFLYIR